MKENFNVQVDGTSVIVIDPANDSTAVYQKQFAKSQLVLTYSWIPTDASDEARRSFQVGARQAAVALCWIT
jgi:hypothetical protein